MSHDKNEPVEIEGCIVVTATDKALLIDYEGDEQWIPKALIDLDSEIDKNSEKGDEGVLVIPQWKAEELGWA